MPEKAPGSDDLDAKPVRRAFTPEFKARILAEYDAAPDATARGAILRRERLYGSHILDWRKARDAGAAVSPQPDREGLTKPSNDAVRRIRKRLSTEVRALRGSNADTVIAKLNPIINGWSAYYRIGVSKRVFNALDAHVWKLVYKWATFTHANKSRRWVTARYFGKFNPSRQDKWVFGSRETGFYLRKFAWTPIVRHRMVAGTASPDDPSLTDYWTHRRRRNTPPIDTTTQRLLRAQHGRCPICRGLLLHADREPRSPQEWEQWLTATRKAFRRHAVVAWGAGTPDERVATRLIHTHCHRRITGNGSDPALPPTREPSGPA